MSNDELVDSLSRALGIMLDGIKAEIGEATSDSEVAFSIVQSARRDSGWATLGYQDHKRPQRHFPRLITVEELAWLAERVDDWPAGWNSDDMLREARQKRATVGREKFTLAVNKLKIDDYYAYDRLLKLPNLT